MKKRVIFKLKYVRFLRIFTFFITFAEKIKI